MQNNLPFQLPDRLPRAVASLLAQCDEIIYDDKLPVSAGTGLVQGRLTLMLGNLFLRSSAEIQREILKHECAHFFLGHLGRQGDRQMRPWNAVCDASIHHTECCDWQAVERHFNEIEPAPPGSGGHKLITFERLTSPPTPPIPPMPPEFAYELLPKTNVGTGAGDEKDSGDGESCGSFAYSHDDGSIESKLKAAGARLKIAADDPEFAQQITRNKMAGTNSGGGRAVPDIAPPPAWIRGTIEYLTHTLLRLQPKRSWMREHRGMPDVLPGRYRQHAKKARIFVDASGSIDEATLRVFLGAICGTPELQFSDVIVFDSTPSDPIPVGLPNDIVAAVKAKGGGTSIKATGEACREPGIAAVWLTDGYTGDGWPSRHTTHEVWCVTSTDVTPPNGVTIRAPIGGK